MIFNVWTFLFEVVNFLVLVAILRWLLYQPLREAIDHRREANAKAQADAEAARQQAESLQHALDRQLADLDHQREAAVREARDRAEAERQTLLADTETAIRHRREEVEQQIVRERDEAVRSLRAELVHSAVEMADRLLREAADSTLQRQLAGRLVEELARLPDDDRRRLRGEWDDGEGAIVETASELDPEALRDLDKAIELLAGRPLAFSVRVRPELLGGVRLRIGGHVWDASMAGRLEELESGAPGGAPAGVAAS